MTDGSWCINTPAPSLLGWSNSGAWSVPSLRAPQQGWAPLTPHGNWLNNGPLPFFPYQCPCAKIGVSGWASRGIQTNPFLPTLSSVLSTHSRKAEGDLIRV